MLMGDHRTVDEYRLEAARCRALSEEVEHPMERADFAWAAKIYENLVREVAALEKSGHWPPGG
jgi:hypothetical protein